jgi:hypothetical protein
LSCHECDQNRQRVEHCEEAEELLLLFMNTFSELSQKLADIERERLRVHYEKNPPPPGATAMPRRRFLLVPIDTAPDEEPPKMAKGEKKRRLASS